MNYLISLLEGPAYRNVAGLDLTEGNHKNASETLQDRFGNKQKLISAHMQALMQLQECPNAIHQLHSSLLVCSKCLAK